MLPEEVKTFLSDVKSGSSCQFQDELDKNTDSPEERKMYQDLHDACYSLTKKCLEIIYLDLDEDSKEILLTLSFCVITPAIFDKVQYCKMSADLFQKGVVEKNVIRMKEMPAVQSLFMFVLAKINGENPLSSLLKRLGQASPNSGSGFPSFLG